MTVDAIHAYMCKCSHSNLDFECLVLRGWVEKLLCNCGTTGKVHGVVCAAVIGGGRDDD